MPSIAATLSTVAPRSGGGLARGYLATYALVGTGTAWSGSTVFSLVGVSGASIYSQSVTDATHATVVVIIISNPGPFDGSDGTTSFTFPAAAVIFAVTSRGSADAVTVGPSAGRISKSAGKA